MFERESDRVFVQVSYMFLFNVSLTHYVIEVLPVLLTAKDHNRVGGVLATGRVLDSYVRGPQAEDMSVGCKMMY